jgi:hypothetical protein
MTYIQIQSMFEPFFPPGRLVYTKSNFLRNLGDDVIENLAQFVGNHLTNCFIGLPTMVLGSTPPFRVSVTGRRRSGVRSFRNFVNWFGQSGRTTSRFSQARTRAVFSKKSVIHPAPTCMMN